MPLTRDHGPHDALVGHADGRRGRSCFCRLASPLPPSGSQAYKGILPLCLAAILLAACAGPLSRPVMVDCGALGLTPVTDPNRRLEFPAQGFSVLPPRGDHWCFQLESKGVLFHKNFLGGRLLTGPPALVERAHTFGALARGDPAEAAKLRNPAELQAFVANWLHGEGRFTQIQAAVDPDRSFAAECVRNRGVWEERENPRARGGVFVLTSDGFVCWHPAAPRLVLIAVSERYLQGDQPRAEALKDETEAFLRSLVFSAPR